MKGVSLMQKNQDELFTKEITDSNVCEIRKQAKRIFERCTIYKVVAYILNDGTKPYIKFIDKTLSKDEVQLIKRRFG